MTKFDLLQLVVYLGIILTFVKPLGWYMDCIYAGNIWGRDLRNNPIERIIYKLGNVDPLKEMDWKHYLISLLIFNCMGWLIAYGIFRLQGSLPLNPQMLPNIDPDLAFNTAASTISNTGWQAYAGEATMSYLSQTVVLTVHSFVSGATGMCVLIAFIRGICRSETTKLGNFWVDCIRSILYILLPIAFVLAIILVSQGTIQNFAEYQTVSLVESFKTESGSIINTQTIPMGPVATLVASKLLCSCGVGFFNVNFAHPFENPTTLTNLLGLIALLIIPAAFCYTYGMMIKMRSHGWAILITMLLIYIPSALLVMHAEQHGNPKLIPLGIEGQPNYEGKELRIGVIGSSIWTVSTAASGNGSVNSMIDSLMPKSSLIALVLMHLGELVFGGVGNGLYAMIFVILITVFLAGLMIGRSPEYVGKKIEPFEMKMIVLVILVIPLLILVLSALACVTPAAIQRLSNEGAQGFSEILYAYTSASKNNGSAMSGLDADTLFYNMTLGATMIINRYWVAIATLAVGGSLARKKYVPASLAFLTKHQIMFVILLVCAILFVGGLTFFPTLALGPMVEFLVLWSVNGV